MCAARQRRIIAGLLVGVVVFAAAGYGVAQHRAGEHVCVLGSPAAEIVAQGLDRHDTASSILYDAFGVRPATPPCTAAVTSLTNDPATPVKIQLSTTVGTGNVHELSASQFSVVPPAEPIHQPACKDWPFDFARQECLDGLIGPPMGSA